MDLLNIPGPYLFFGSLFALVVVVHLIRALASGRSTRSKSPENQMGLWLLLSLFVSMLLIAFVNYSRNQPGPTEQEQQHLVLKEQQQPSNQQNAQSTSNTRSTRSAMENSRTSLVFDSTMLKNGYYTVQLGAFNNLSDTQNLFLRLHADWPKLPMAIKVDERATGTTIYWIVTGAFLQQEKVSQLKTYLDEEYNNCFIQTLSPTDLLLYPIS